MVMSKDKASQRTTKRQSKLEDTGWTDFMKDK